MSGCRHHIVMYVSYMYRYKKLVATSQVVSHIHTIYAAIIRTNCSLTAIYFLVGCHRSFSFVRLTLRISTNPNFRINAPVPGYYTTINT
jgi:hypothetical protein